MKNVLLARKKNKVFIYIIVEKKILYTLKNFNLNHDKIEIDTNSFDYSIKKKNIQDLIELLHKTIEIHVENGVDCV